MYIVFGGFHYDEAGGWRDFLGDFSSPEAACAFADDLVERGDIDWFHVVSISEKRIVIVHDDYGTRDATEDDAKTRAYFLSKRNEKA